jgi:hypothetical protein
MVGSTESADIINRPHNFRSNDRFLYQIAPQKGVEMSSLRKNKLFWVALLTCSALAAGLVALLPLGTTQSAWAQTGPSSDSSLLGVPIGTILPFAGSLEALPSNWLPCDGRAVEDPKSPLRGSKVPDLTDNRFLMGVGPTETVGTTGGTNAISPDGRHGHAGTATDRVTQKTGSPRYLDTSGNKGFKHTHNLSIKSDGLHSHGGDNRPSFYAVRFIIRVR